MPTWAEIAKKPVEPVKVPQIPVKPMKIPQIVHQKKRPINGQTFEKLEWDKYEKPFFNEFALRYG